MLYAHGSYEDSYFVERVLNVDIRSATTGLAVLSTKEDDLENDQAKAAKLFLYNNRNLRLTRRSSKPAVHALFIWQR